MEPRPLHLAPDDLSLEDQLLFYNNLLTERIQFTREVEAELPWAALQVVMGDAQETILPLLTSMRNGVEGFLRLDKDEMSEGLASISRINQEIIEKVYEWVDRLKSIRDGDQSPETQQTINEIIEEARSRVIARQASRSQQ